MLGTVRTAQSHVYLLVCLAGEERDGSAWRRELEWPPFAAICKAASLEAEKKKRKNSLFVIPGPGFCVTSEMKGPQFVLVVGHAVSGMLGKMKGKCKNT